MARTVTVIPFERRLAEVSARLHFLTDGSAERLSQMRGDMTLPLPLRCELAYLVKLRSQMAGVPCNCYVETVIAGKPDGERRVFARITHIPEDDGLTIDLYDHSRTRIFPQIAHTIEIETPAPKRGRKGAQP